MARLRKKKPTAINIWDFNMDQFLDFLKSNHHYVVTQAKVGDSNIISLIPEGIGLDELLGIKEEQ